MFAVETPEGRFEAETERDAIKAARKAAKAAKTAQDEAEGYRKQAYLRAYANAYLTLMRKGNGALRRGALCKPNEPCGPKVMPYDGTRCKAVYSTADGEVSIDHYGYRPIAVGTDAGGWTVAVFLQDCDKPDRIEGYAIGVCETAWAFAELIGVEMADWS